MDLNTDVKNIYGVGATIARRLKILGIETAADLLYYYPFRYDDFREISPIGQLEIGANANVVGRVELIQNRRSPRKRLSITEALVADDSEQMKVIWFNQPFIAKNLHVGDTVSLSGKVDDDYGSPIMKSPVYEKLYSGAGQGDGPGGARSVHTQGLVPNYHLTANMTNKQVRYLVKQVIALADKLPDWLPAEILKKEKLLGLGQAIKKIHFPKDYGEIDEAKRRLSFEELFLLQLESQMIKAELKASRAETIKFNEAKTKKFVAALPFQLTNAQRKAAWEILLDLEKGMPMARLLEGDVGSGKTVVAVIAMYNTALNKKQSVLMVPTEILAHQHFESISKLLKATNLTVGLITRTRKAININPEEEKITPQFVIDNSSIVIGTHALIQEKIRFENLALAIIDEQHRFGVEQRKLLTKKANPEIPPKKDRPLPDKTKIHDIPAVIRQSTIDNRQSKVPHLLSMTATPIPRSLALALYGDLDLSVIGELPKGRKKILTRVVPEAKRSDAYDFIGKQINSGRQAFVICPLIDISDKLGVKSVTEEFKRLDQQIFPSLKIAMLHGRLKGREKEEIMQAFLAGETKILVSTSVVEVGVDVPNASVMMIEGADRFGLAQLHQFRGRVGRSEHQSYCFLFAGSDAPQSLARLKAMETRHDGFELAKIDLRYRGPGEVYGTAQKGFPQLKVASLFDYKLMQTAQEEAKALLEGDPKLKNHPLLKAKLGDLKNFHLE